MALDDSLNGLSYAMVGNIPYTYHSKDLRNFFSQFVETCGLNCFHFRHRPEEIPIVKVVDDVDETQAACSTSTSTRSSAKKNGTTCCIVRLTHEKRDQFVKAYHRKHWLDSNGDSMRPLCNVVKIKVNSSSQSGACPYRTRSEQKNIPSSREEFTVNDLEKLGELHPPDLMPNGNVGTPTKLFLNFIQACRLPPAVIKKLGLSFPRTRSNKRYGNVPFDYGGDKCEVYNEEDLTVLSGQGHLIENENPDIEKSIQAKKKERERLREEEIERKEIEKEKQTDSDSGDDNDTCEEWERHEAMTDDPSNQERNKERLFEEEIELKWEKGGSGLVFYTDAQFWQAKEEGDFDEQTADDWDVDMSVYYEEGGGDKDSRDYVQMRQDRRRREGTVLESVFKKKGNRKNIGKFERHTKGIGRRIMEQQGWTDGQGLGTSVNPGISDALEGEGQTPWNKKGFGYRGEKINRYFGTNAKRKRPESNCIISTIYDNPTETDPVEPLLRRSDPYHITYRQEFKKASKS